MIYEGDCLEIMPTLYRKWAMPSANTFNIKPISEFVHKYLSKSSISIDPFARNKRWATYTNDLNPNTDAEYHIDVLEFLQKLNSDGIKADLVIFDPPYSLEQLKRSYENIGRKYTNKDGWKPGRWTKEKNIINDLLVYSGIVLSFGWNSYGMGTKRGFKIIDLMLVCHGAGHNDTICMAENRLDNHQPLLMAMG